MINSKHLSLNVRVDSGDALIIRSIISTIAATEKRNIAEKIGETSGFMDFIALKLLAQKNTANTIPTQDVVFVLIHYP